MYIFINGQVNNRIVGPVSQCLFTHPGPIWQLGQLWSRLSNGSKSCQPDLDVKGMDGNRGGLV